MLDNVGNMTTTIAAGIVGSVVSVMSREPSSDSCMRKDRITFFIRCLVALFTGEMTTL